ncbi:MAG: hypothetical protein QXE84_04225 [Candidatus Nitrosotenuis sp.]|uniref:hypothetical protein n=1 Tax=Candidatus Nitrosotenuis uzonensis TaxID=1407055 RepID=UPI0019616F44|nr:hypothetical protein [Candidatus Nitrosotenuis uzonensis]MCA2003371.1 hypothetical protein [Candidatus Nitrosotenuis sp.]
MDRIRRLVMQVLDKHKNEFTTDFTENKKILDQIAIIRSKGLKNEMAGFITKYIKLEAATKAQKQQREARAEAEREEQAEEIEETTAQVEQTSKQVEEENASETDSEQEEIVMESQSPESN